METRDQWYKPNLLYNIHYRPPKKPEAPIMIVETVQFNPSVCTCGQHGCQQQYRMEKRVLWAKKEELRNTKQQSKVKGRENKIESGENKFNESVTKHGKKDDSIIESKQIRLKEETGHDCCFKESVASNQMGLKSETDQEFRFIEGDGKKCVAAKNFKNDEGGVKNSYQDDGAVQDIENTEAESNDDGGIDEKEKKEKKQFDCKNEVRSNGRKSYVLIGKEANYTDSIRENSNNGKSDRDNFEGRINKEVNREKRICNGCETAFKYDCNNEESSSKEGQIDNNCMTGDDAGTTDSSIDCNNEELCSTNRILSNTSTVTADTRRPENEDDDFEDVGISSAFGIMSIYCNSELHNWRSFEEKQIH